jgi:hypothetical protein
VAGGQHHKATKNSRPDRRGATIEEKDKIEKLVDSFDIKKTRRNFCISERIDPNISFCPELRCLVAHLDSGNA